MTSVQIKDIPVAAPDSTTKFLGVDSAGAAKLADITKLVRVVVPPPSLAKRGQTISIQSVTQIQAAIAFSTVAVGATPVGGGARPTIALTSNSLTHAKVLYIPEGFAGYTYWMIATPFFGSIGSDSQYENPHIFASNDGKNFVEPAGISNPIDLPVGELGSNNYWSDTHLLLGDDGWLYAIYRSVGSALGGGTTNWYKRSRDGVTWSDRTLVISSATQVSPVVHKSGAAHIYYDVVLNPFGANTRGIQRLVSYAGPVSGYDARSAQNYITLDSAPWGASDGPWHLDVEKVGNVYLALINSGPLSGSGGTKLWLAWSLDGWAWSVINQQLAPTGQYRSCITPVGYGDGYIDLIMYACATGTGVVSPYSIRLVIA